MISAIGTSIGSVLDGNSGSLSSTAAQIVAVEAQLQACQTQLLSAQQQASTQAGLQQIKQLKDKIAQLEVQMTELQEQQSQQIQQAQSSHHTQATAAVTEGAAAGASHHHTPASNPNLPNAITHALAQSLSSSSGNSGNPISAKIAAVEGQLQTYQTQLQNAQQGASSPIGQIQVQQITSQITQLTAQLTQLEAQHAQHAQLAAASQQAAANQSSHANLPNADAVAQALAQSGEGSATAEASSAASGSTSVSSSVSETTQAALQAFMKNLFTALGQENSMVATGVNGSSSGHPSWGHHQGDGSHLSANIQSLIQQLDAHSQANAVNSQSHNVDKLNNLNASFQNLVGLLEPASAPTSGQNTATTTTPSLHVFLQNLAQDLGHGLDISGVVVNTQL